MAKSDSQAKAFITFRVAGESLHPEQVTQLLKIQATTAHEKGETYSSGRFTVKSRTGIWLFRTDTVIFSGNLDDHIRLMLVALGLKRPLAMNDVVRLLRLSQFLKEGQHTAAMTFFWHGPPDAPYPRVPEQFEALLNAIPIGIELDFDRDEESATRRMRAS